MTHTNGLAAASAVPDHLAQAALAPAADFEPDGIPVDECDGEDHDDPDDDGALYCNTGALACLFDELTEPDCDPAKRIAAVAALRVPDGMVRVGDIQLGDRLAWPEDPRGYVVVVGDEWRHTEGVRALQDDTGSTGVLMPVDELLALYTGPVATPEALALADSLDRVAGLLRTGVLPAGYIAKLSWHTRNLGDTHAARLAVIEQTATAVGGTVDHEPADDCAPGQVHHHARARIGPLDVDAVYLQRAGEADGPAEVTA